MFKYTFSVVATTIACTFSLITTTSTQAQSIPSYHANPIDIPNGITSVDLFKDETSRIFENTGNVIGWHWSLNSAGDTCRIAPWHYDGQNIKQIGLEGDIYTLETTTDIFKWSDIDATNSNGYFAGRTFQFLKPTTVPKSSNFDRIIAEYGFGHDAWVYNGKTTVQVGLTGGIYEYIYEGHESDIFRSSTVDQLNNLCQAIGTSKIKTHARPEQSNHTATYDTWLYDGTTSKLINLTGTDYEYTDSYGFYRNSYFTSQWEQSAKTHLNQIGQVSGNSQRFSTSGDDLGVDTWFYDGTSTKQVGLIGEDYEYHADNGTYRKNFSHICNDKGFVLGHSTRYASNSENLGKDTWLYNGSNTIQIGLAEDIHQYNTDNGTYRYNAVYLSNYKTSSSADPSTRPMTNDGHVVGYSKRFSSKGEDLGQDMWLHHNGKTKQIGLFGKSYEYAKHNATFSFSGITTDAEYDLKVISDNGYVTGYTKRFSQTGDDLGQDIWFYNGNDTHLIGLTGDDYEYESNNGIYRSSQTTVFEIHAENAIFVNNITAGTTKRYNSTGKELGEDAWIFNGQETIQVGLTSSEFQGITEDGIYRSSNIDNAFSNGFISGSSYRYNNDEKLGSSAWIYDIESKETIDLRFKSENSQTVFSYITYISDDKQILGVYEDIDNEDQLSGIRAFMWDETHGMFDITDLITNSDILVLDNKQFWGDNPYAFHPLSINKNGEILAGVYLDNNYIIPFKLTPNIPEPSTLILISLGMLVCRRPLRLH